MKQFKKRRNKLPKEGSVYRLISKLTPELRSRYLRELAFSDNRLPQCIREVTLAHRDPNARANFRYYPDIKNFKIYEAPNRSVPIRKFLDLFRGMIPDETMEQLIHDLTAYRLEFYRERDQWITVYQDENVHSCMSQSSYVGDYPHSENFLALATLYAPNNPSVVARSIVNTHEKWWVRIFGDELLAIKLKEQGYRKLRSDEYPNEFKMYAFVGNHPQNTMAHPYFDFNTCNIRRINDTYDPELRRVQIIVNQGVTHGQRI